MLWTSGAIWQIALTKKAYELEVKGSRAKSLELKDAKVKFMAREL